MSFGGKKIFQFIDIHMVVNFIGIFCIILYNFTIFTSQRITRTSFLIEGGSADSYTNNLYIYSINIIVFILF